MAASPIPDPSQQAQPQPSPTPDAQGGAPGGAAGGPPPELQTLGQLLTICRQVAQQYPSTSDGLAKAIAGINEAASAVMTQPQQQAPSQSPPY